METQKIKFVSNRTFLTEDSISAPKPILKTIPDWYRKADRFYKNPLTGEYYYQNDEKVLTWKGCPAVFDTMISGYTLITPCDILFYEENGIVKSKVDDKRYQDFCTDRPPMPQFLVPLNYHTHHFAWFPDWATELPEGYSALYMQPLNRFELPFYTISGIIDNDKVNLPGYIPFLLAKGFTGVLPAGTAYMQVFPFKRESWKSEIVIENPNKIPSKNYENSLKYRTKEGGVYRNQVWEKRSYE